MSLLPYTFFPRSMFDMDFFHRPYGFGYSGPTTLDLFDPFDEVDQLIARNFQWINKPEFLQQFQTTYPRIPQKYRVVVDCAGYDPKSIKTDVSGRKLTVTGREDYKTNPEDYSTKEFKKTYELPAHCESDKLVSFMTPYGNLVIEFPLKETSTQMNADLFPKIVDQNGTKMVTMKFGVPENIDPSKIQVSIKDRDLICKVEDKVQRPDSTTRFYYYKRATLPENTDFEQLKCHYDQGKLSVQAPIRSDYRPYRTVPIDYKGQQYLQYGQPQYGMQYGQYGQK